MKIWSSSTEIRINGNYGTTPDMASIWFGGNGNSGGGYGTWRTSVYVNLSSSIPSCFVGFEVMAQGSNTGNNAWGQVSYIAGYGVNSGGTSLSANNQNYEWYTNNSEANIGQMSSLGFDGTNRRFGIGFFTLDYSVAHVVYGRVISNAISYITISYA